MINSLLILSGKIISKAIQIFNLGNGSTWPGHIALSINQNFIKDILRTSQIKIVFVVGTNGKTTTTGLIKHILEADGKKVIQNKSGANLLNGIASTLLLQANMFGKINTDYALFEIDENAFPPALKEIQPHYIVMLNLFRDQLDRYGEVNAIAQKWQKALEILSSDTTFVLNADDPQIAFLEEKIKGKIYYFGLDKTQEKKAGQEHASDSTYCPNCGTKLSYTSFSYSHLGIWNCPNCDLKRPSDVFVKYTFYPLDGVYNKYNTHAAVLLSRQMDIPEKITEDALHSFQPAFGRQETLQINGKTVKIFLAKNPTGFNESLRTIKDLGARTVLLVLNDQIADGKDISWIWDIDFEDLLPQGAKIVISGDRTYDMGLRIKYAKYQIQNTEYKIEPDLKIAIKNIVQQTPLNEALYILPTYTAMLQVREILTGKKIL
jgi:UDP-N-acetylmuramyl tripeptide synthase